MSKDQGVQKGASDEQTQKLQCAVPAAGGATDHQRPEEPGPTVPEYELAPRVVGRWKAAYRQQGEQAFCRPGARATIDELSVQRRLSELERLCGRLALENELLKKLGWQT